MKTGAELIAEERQEQIEKHGWTEQHDRQEHEDEYLATAACIIAEDSRAWEPYYDWAFKIRENKQLKYKDDVKEKIERYKIAGALLAAEIDRLQNQ